MINSKCENVSTLICSQILNDSQCSSISECEWDNSCISSSKQNCNTLTSSECESVSLDIVSGPCIWIKVISLFLFLLFNFIFMLFIC
jgi:hypothetical protein